MSISRFIDLALTVDNLNRAAKEFEYHAWFVMNNKPRHGISAISRSGLAMSFLTEARDYRATVRDLETELS